MNVVSFIFCFAIRIVDLVIRAFDTFCVRVTKIYEDGRSRQQRTGSPSTSGPRNDLQKWALRLVGILLLTAYVWVMLQELSLIHI